MIELTDPSTKTDIWATKVTAARDVVTMATKVDSVLGHVTCLICERRWAGSIEEITEFLEVHEHDLVLHIEWYLATHRGWPAEFVDLIRQLLESEIVDKRRFLDLREKLTR